MSPGGSKLQFYPEVSALKEESQVYILLGQHFFFFGCILGVWGDGPM